MSIRRLAFALHAPAVLVAASPFAGLYAEDGISTSRDEYGIWTSWTAAAYSLKFPGRPPTAWREGEDPALAADIAIACRADGRPQGYSGPAPAHATLRLPLHPDEPDVPSFFNPMYWFTVLVWGESETTPASVRIGERPPFASELVRPLVDWSFPRPGPEVRLKPAEALLALSSGDGASVIVDGPDTRLELRFAPAPALARAARLMERHCEIPPARE